VLASERTWDPAPDHVGCLGPGTSSDYEAWNHALANRFFPRMDKRGLVYLAVDDETLTEVGEAIGVRAEEAVQRYVSAVRDQLVDDSSPYRRFLYFMRRWQERGTDSDPPPYLSLLGLCVLAASRMASDEVVRSNNYYVRYHELIGDESRGMPHGFRSIAELWRDLSEWLDVRLAGRIGRSTIPAEPYWSNIGYPLSQCLLREVDRRRLTYFFRAVRLDPDDDLSPDELLVLLRAWASHSPGALTRHGHAVLRDHSRSVEEQLREVVADEFREWDGELRDRSGRRVADLLIHMRLSHGGSKFELRLVARRPEGFPEGEFQTPSGGRFTLRSVTEDWYEPLPISVDSQLLDHGMDLTQGAFRLSYSHAPVIPFRQDLDLGAFVSAGGVEPGTVHWVLVADEYLDAVARFARLYAEPGWSWARGSEGLPPGWRFFRGLEVTQPVGDVGGPLRVLSPLFHAATGLRGGLQLRPRFYLQGGEPDLWVGVSTSESTSVIIDGEQRAEAGMGSTRVPLADLELPARDHEIRVGAATRRFSTLEGFPVILASGAGRLAERFRRQGSSYQPIALGASVLPHEASLLPGDVVVSGAHVLGHTDDLPHQPHRPILIRAGWKRIVALGNRPGDVEILRPPPERRWLRELGLQEAQQSIEYHPEFRLQWIVKVGVLNTALVQDATANLLAPVARGVGSDEQQKLWKDTILHAAEFAPDSSSEAATMWMQYVRCAQEMAE
jgi:hypothetical protein